VSDFDGYSSGSMMYDSLVKLGCKNVTYVLHNENPKAHGFEDDEIMETLRNSEPCLLIVPDAGTPNVEQHKELYTLGYEILVLDHHEADESVLNDSPALIINNKLINTVENKSGSGALVTWHFIHYMDSALANKYNSYVAISLLSDSMDCRTDENGTFLHWGLREKNLHSNIKPLVDALNKTYNPYDYSFGFIPKANATIRCGELSTKKLLFEVMAGIEKDSKKIEQCIKEMKKCHSTQSNETKRLMAESVEIEDEDEPVILGKITEKTPFTGLVANKLMSEYNKPILLVHDRTNGCSDGSARSPIEFKEILNDSDMFNYAEGHSCAFGVSYNTSDEEQVKNFLYSLTLSEPQIDVLTYYSKILPLSNIIDRFEPFKNVWTASGSNVVEPSFGFTYVVKRSDINFIGRTGTTMKFHIGEWDFIKFFCSNAWKDETLNIYKPSQELELTFVGKMQWNEYMGKRTPQVVIDKIEIKEHEDDALTLFM
jgi:single-stranded-DNA-specific exonuclease